MKAITFSLITLCFFGFVSAQTNILKDTLVIPGTDVRYVMAQIPAGKFMMGSPDKEKGRQPNEGPQHEARVDSFWISVFEVTFTEYYQFQFRDRDNDSTATDVDTFRADAVTRPSPPYFDFVYGRSRTEGYPAASMTQQAALRYCQWLSAKTGRFYRLATEAEWEYACRAGSETAYSYGKDAKKLSDYAVFYDNSKGSYARVGSKLPNAFGLYDMHGNLAEWTLDFYADDYFTRLATHADNPVIWPERKHSRTVRGGSYEDFAEACRSATRLPSDPKWQQRDPQIPKSKWWNPDSPFVGFRICSPVNQPTPEAQAAFWAKAIKD